MRFLRLLDEKLEEYFLVASLVVTVSLIFAQIVMRYLVGQSLYWSEELARYIFLWQIWIGTSFAVKHAAHIRVDFFRNLLPDTWKNRLDFLVLAIWLAFVVFLAIESWTLISLLIQRHQLTPALRIPIAYAYLSVPVGCSLMILRLCQTLFLKIGASRRGV